MMRLSTIISKRLKRELTAKYCMSCRMKRSAHKSKKVFSILGKITMSIDGRKQHLELDEQKHLRFFEFVSLTQIQDYLVALNA